MTVDDYCATQPCSSVLGNSTSLFVQTFPVVYAEQMRVCAAGAAAATLFCIIIERIMATTKLQSYEKQRNKKFIAFTVCYSCFFGGLSTFFVFSHEINLLGFEVAGAFFSLCLVGRFQLSENIRSSKIMKRCFIIVKFGFFFMMTMLMYDSLLDNNNKLHSFVIRTAYNLMVCVISLLAIVVGIASTAVWRRQIIKMFKKCTFCLSCAIQSRRISEFHTRTSFSSEEVIIVRRVSRTHLRNGDGKPMAFSHEVEKDMYFAHLRQTWS
uniref:Uncharacterized protein n=1 Tax=Ditylenchus dipsaci TaxID=166011 RepID=A0A915DKU6_9BILA